MAIHTIEEFATEFKRVVEKLEHRLDAIATDVAAIAASMKSERPKKKAPAEKLTSDALAAAASDSKAKKQNAKKQTSDAASGSKAKQNAKKQNAPPKPSGSKAKNKPSDALLELAKYATDESEDSGDGSPHEELIWNGLLTLDDVKDHKSKSRLSLEGQSKQDTSAILRFLHEKESARVVKERKGGVTFAVKQGNGKTGELMLTKWNIGLVLYSEAWNEICKVNDAKENQRVWLYAQRKTSGQIVVDFSFRGPK